MSLANTHNGLPVTVTSPEAAGISSDSVLRFLKALDAQAYRLHSFLLVRRGRLCFAGASRPYTLQTPHRVYSAGKSILALSVCRAMQEGKLKPDDRVADYFRDLLSGDARFDKLTVSDLLTMRSGQTDDPFLAILKDLDADLTRLFFTAPPVDEPGKVFRYNNTIPTVICALVERAVGMPFAAYQNDRIFAPLNAQVFAPVNPQGQYNPVVMAMSAETLMKFALLFLYKGIWNGSRVIDAGWMNECVREHTRTGMQGNAAGYGWQIWRNAFGGYRLDGGWGQYAVILPEEELAAVIMSDMPVSAFALEAFERELMPGLSKETLPENPAALAELGRYGEQLTLAPQGCKAHSAMEPVIGAHRYCFSDPAMELRFAFENDALKIMLTEEGRAQEFHAGLNGGWLENKRHLLVTPERTIDNGVYCMDRDACFCTAVWRDEQTLDMLLKSLGAQGEYLYRFSFSPEGLTLSYPPHPCRGGPSLHDAVTLTGKGADPR